MALIQCPECGKEISDKANVCIHCGYPMASNTNNKQFDEYTLGEDLRMDGTHGENNSKEACKRKITFYRSKWLIIPILMICLLLLIVWLLPCKHEWIEATCTAPRYCQICDEIEGAALGHAAGEWTIIKEPTLSDNGKEEVVCTVCAEILDSREIDTKQPEIIDNTFNFTDDELIDWANGWLNDTYVIEDSGTFDLGNDILGYRVETDDGESGMLLLKHDGGDEVAAIMVYFEDFVDRTALNLFFGTKINPTFDYDDAALVLANDSTYFAANMIITNLTIDDGLEVAVLAPESYMYEIVAGTMLTPSDCYVSIENNEELFQKYDNNMRKLIVGEYGGNDGYWFFDEDLNDDIHEGFGVIKTFRGITLGVSTEKDIIAAYGNGVQIDFNKNTDIIYRVCKSSGRPYEYLENTQKVLIYEYPEQFQIAMFIDSTGIVDCILYTDGVFY